MKISSMFICTLSIVTFIFVLGGCACENGGVIVEYLNYNDLIASEKIVENYICSSEEILSGASSISSSVLSEAEESEQLQEGDSGEIYFSVSFSAGWDGWLRGGVAGYTYRFLRMDSLPFYVVEPPEPWRYRHVFRGWHTRRSIGYGRDAVHEYDKFDFSVPITDSVLISALWEPDLTAPWDPSPTPSATHYASIRFDPMGGIFPNGAVSKRYTVCETRVIEPEPPIRNGYVFLGWFRDEAATRPFNFETDHIVRWLDPADTLYAAWTPIAMYPLDVPSVEINGIAVNFPDQAPVIINGRTFVPIRVVSEELGVDVTWRENTREVELTRDRDIIIFTIGNHFFTVNDHRRTFEVPPQIINGRTMLPLRDLLESVGYSVKWDSERNVIIVSG